MKTLCVTQVANNKWKESHASKFEYLYEVTKVINSVKPMIGFQMNRDELADKCDDADWNVVIV